MTYHHKLLVEVNRHETNINMHAHGDNQMQGGNGKSKFQSLYV